jgi:hypothetical protein
MHPIEVKLYVCFLCFCYKKSLTKFDNDFSGQIYKVKKVKISLLQAVEAPRVAWSQGSRIT